MTGPLIEALMSLITGPRVFGSLVLAIAATFLGAWLGGETGAAIAFFVVFPVAYVLIMIGQAQERPER
jgi:hypothetical protein